MAAMIPGGRPSPDGSSIIIVTYPGTPDTGLWCDRCALPSGLGIPIYVLADDGPRLLVYSRMCMDCGLPLTIPEDM